MSVVLQVRVNGGAPSSGDVTAVAGDVIQMTAASKSGWRSATWRIYDFPPELTVPSGWTTDADGSFYKLGAADPDTFTIPATPSWGPYALKLTVDEGAGEVTDPSTIVTVVSPTLGLKGVARGEGATRGGTRKRWVGSLMTDLRALSTSVAALVDLPQTVHTDDGALTFSRVNILTSVADGMTIPAVAANAGKRMLVINAMAATTAVLTRSGADVVVNGTSATAYNLPAGESCWVTAGATGSNVYIEHGGSGGGGSGTEPPTGSTTLLRKSDGVGRVTGVQIETDTDANRSIKALRADATTRDEMTIDTTALRIKGAAGENTCSILPDVDTSPVTVVVRQSDGATADGLQIDVSSLAVAGTGLCSIETTGACVHSGTSHTRSAFGGAYSEVYTPAAGATLVYGNDLTSLTDRIAQKAAGAGAARYILGGLGASGSANGQFLTGLENGNTVLGGLHGLHVGSLVGGVSDKLSVLTGTPGSGVSIFDVFAVATNSTRIQTPGSYAFGIFSANTVSIGSNISVGLSATAITLSGNDYLLNAGQYLSTPESIAFAASLTLNFNLSDGLLIGTLTANITTVTVTNAYGGSTKKVKVTMGGAGSYTIAWGSEFKFGATYSGTPDATVGHVTEWVFDVISSTEIRCIGKETYTS
jgi:hypothetical protein